MNCVEIRSTSLTFAFGPPWARRAVHAVRNVSLDIARGATLGLVGESGSGKTTLGRLCLGILRPDAGEVRIEGISVAHDRRRLRGRLQVVGQHPQWALDPRLRIGTSVMEPLVISGTRTRSEQRDKVSKALGLVGLDPSLSQRYPHQLSGGQRQRAAIARALITSPSFIVFDEAVAALDVSVQAQILNLIRDLQVEQGFAALFISHDLASVRYVSHTIGVMYAGELVEVGPASVFYGAPFHPYSITLQAAVPGAAREAMVRPDSRGDVPTMGCVVAPRCRAAITRCWVERPALRAFQGGLVACHRAGELDIREGQSTEPTPRAPRPGPAKSG
jgi:oligopeptide/dipeptide ABC transporter ATP-binding protein